MKNLGFIKTIVRHMLWSLIPDAVIKWLVVRAFAEVSVKRYPNKAADKITVFDIYKFYANHRRVPWRPEPGELPE